MFCSHRLARHHAVNNSARDPRPRMPALPAPAAIALLLLPALLLPVNGALAAPGLLEVTETNGSTRMVRSITIVEDGVIHPVPHDGMQLPEGSRGSDTYKWLDTNHLDAIADGLAITGDGLYGIVGWWLNNKRTALYEIADDNVPEWTRSMPLVSFDIAVAADYAGDCLTSTGRNDSLYVFGAASAEPAYSHWYTSPLVGYHCGVSSAGNTYAATAGDPPGIADAEVSVYDGSGAMRFRHALFTNPEGIAVSHDGLVVGANTRTVVKVWDAMTGVQRDSLPIPGDTQTPAVLSGDGTYLVTGGFSRYVRVYEWDGTDYTFLWSHLIPATTWITALGISADGSTIAAGTWTNSNGGKVVLFDRSNSTPLWTDETYGDYVPSVALTPDGGRIVAGSWGLLGGTAGAIISVYDRSSNRPIHTITDDAISGVGSCFTVDISADGNLILAGGKAVHAREMGSGGWVMAIQLTDPSDITSGETDLQALYAYAAAPNPFGSTTRIDFAGGERDCSGKLWIHTPDGRLVRRLHSMEGSRYWSWDGRDDDGRYVPSGAYFVRGATQDAPGDVATHPLRIVWMR